MSLILIELVPNPEDELSTSTTALFSSGQCKATPPRCKPRCRSAIIAALRGRKKIMPPTMANGKICYIEMPAQDIRRLVHVMVDSVEATIEKVIANAGELVQPIGADAPEITVRFRDPGGNVIGLYQEPKKNG
jgi:hypothetical protein